MNWKPYSLLSQPDTYISMFLSGLDHRSINLNLFSDKHSHGIKKFANQSPIVKPPVWVWSQKEGWNSLCKWAGVCYSFDGCEIRDLVTVWQLSNKRPAGMSAIKGDLWGKDLERILRNESKVCLCHASWKATLCSGWWSCKGSFKNYGQHEHCLSSCTGSQNQTVSLIKLKFCQCGALGANLTPWFVIPAYIGVHLTRTAALQRTLHGYCQFSASNLRLLSLQITAQCH